MFSSPMRDCLFSFSFWNIKFKRGGNNFLYIKENLDYKIHNHISDPNGNYIIVDLTIDDNRLTLASIYGPNKDCPKFFNTIISHYENTPIQIY